MAIPTLSVTPNSCRYSNRLFISFNPSKACLLWESLGSFSSLSIRFNPPAIYYTVCKNRRQATCKCIIQFRIADPNVHSISGKICPSMNLWRKVIYLFLLKMWWFLDQLKQNTWEIPEEQSCTHSFFVLILRNIAQVRDTKLLITHGAQLHIFLLHANISMYMVVAGADWQ